MSAACSQKQQKIKSTKMRSAKSAYKKTGYWRRAAMLISFLMMLLASFFVLLLSRGVDSELRQDGLRIAFYQNTEQLLLALLKAEQALILNDSDNSAWQRQSSTIKKIMQNFEPFSSQFMPIKNWQKEIEIFLAFKNDKAKGQAALHKLLQSISARLKDEGEKQYLLHQRLDMLRAALAFAAIIASLSTFLLVYIIYDRFQSDMYRLRAYQAQLEEDNLLLEARVEARTRQLQAAQKHAERERERAEILLQDASHRIGNSLATVSSLLSLQAHNNPNQETKAALIAARDRIQNISAAHRRLRLGQDSETTAIDEFLPLIIQDIISNLAPEIRQRLQFAYDIEPWVINARDATTLAIITAELITNAIKHAFPDKRCGNITIYFKKQQHGPFTLIIEDNGIGMDKQLYKDLAAKGLGQLVTKQLCLQFEAEPYFEKPQRGGTRFIVPLPALSKNGRVRAKHSYH